MFDNLAAKFPPRVSRPGATPHPVYDVRVVDLFNVIAGAVANMRVGGSRK